MDVENVNLYRCEMVGGISCVMKMEKTDFTLRMAELKTEAPKVAQI